MAHYAFLDKNNIVTEVIVGVNENEMLEGKTPEQWYGDFRGQVCKRTSYNTYGNQHNSGGTPFRGNYAGVGDTYDPIWDAFYSPKPYSSWKLNYETFLWEAPTPMPEVTDEYSWFWSEPNLQWEKLKRK